MTRKQIIEQYFTIQTKEKSVVSFIQNKTQNLIDEAREKLKVEHKPVWILILKARQLGVSSKIIADWVADCVLLDNTNCVLLSHEGEATKRLFAKAEFYVNNAKIKPTLSTESQRELRFPKTNSWFYIGTAGSRAFGRGDTIHNLHMTEVAWYQDQSIIVGLLQAVPDGGEVIAETTANGLGDWFQIEWERAKNGESKFYPLFLSWMLDDQYRIKGLNISPTEEEQHLMNVYSLDLEQIAWRREKIREFQTEDLFKQEYPLTDREAFIFSGSGAFDAKALELYKLKTPTVGTLLNRGEQVEFTPDPIGMWHIYKHPEPGNEYVIFCDPAEGKEAQEKDPDYSAIHVLENSTCEQVAEYRFRSEPFKTANELYLAGIYYNTARVGVERNGSGLATLAKLVEIYPTKRIYKMDDSDEYGWVTNNQSRDLMITDLAEAIRLHLIKIYSKRTIDECLSFVRNERGKYEARQGTHDDLCFVKNTMILTPKGQVPIQKIMVGDQVMTREGFKPVKATGSRYADVVSRFGLIGTPNHPIITKRGDIPLTSVRDSDTLYIWNEKLSSIEERNITDIQSQNEDNTESIIGDTINGNNHLLRSIDKSGLIISGLYQSMGLSTTLTMMPPIMRFQTSSLSAEVNMPSTTWERRNEKNYLDKSGGSKAKGLSKLLRDGEKRIQDLLTGWLSKMVNSKLHELSKHSRDGENPIQQKLNVYMFKMARIVSNAYSSITKRKVYNLQVEGKPEYFANNVLVHNCMSLAGAYQVYKSRASPKRRTLEGGQVKQRKDNPYYL